MPPQTNKPEATPARQRLLLHSSISALQYGELDERRSASTTIAGLSICDGSSVEPAIDAVEVLVLRISKEKDEDVLRACLQAICRMASNERLAFEMLLHKEGARPLVKLTKDEGVRSEALACVAVMCVHEDMTAPLIEAGIIDVAHRLAADDAAPAQQLRGVSVLATLAVVPKHRQLLAAAPIMKTLLALAQPAGLDDAESKGPSDHGFPAESTLIASVAAAASASAARLQALRTINRLCSLHAVRAALSDDGSFFAILFPLRDDADPDVGAEADLVARHWDDERFGFCWRCASACRSAAQQLMLPEARPARAARRLRRRRTRPTPLHFRGSPLCSPPPPGPPPRPAPGAPPHPTTPSPAAAA
jgi:hypothetical protein